METQKDKEKLLAEVTKMFEKVNKLVDKEESDLECFNNLQNLREDQEKAQQELEAICSYLGEVWHSLDNCIARIKCFGEE